MGNGKTFIDSEKSSYASLQSLKKIMSKVLKQSMLNQLQEQLQELSFQQRYHTFLSAFPLGRLLWKTGSQRLKYKLVDKVVPISLWWKKEGYINIFSSSAMMLVKKVGKRKKSRNRKWQSRWRTISLWQGIVLMCRDDAATICQVIWYFLRYSIK